jgi:hypothetical protein
LLQIANKLGFSKKKKKKKKVACVFFAAVTFFSSLYQAPVELLEGFMKCAVVMGSGAMTHTKFNEDWFRHSKVDRG